MVAIPPTPDEPKVACNSGARTFYSTPKRCNSNDMMSNLEIHTGELHATFLRNHNMRHHKGPKQKTAQAQKTPTARGERQPQHSRQPTPTGGFTTIDAPPRHVAGASHPYGRNSPHAPDERKVACNSGARTFYSTPKRCNSNDVMSNLKYTQGHCMRHF